MGPFSNNEQVFRDGFQVVVNLSKRKLTTAETSLLSKGVSFCTTSRDINIFALRKDISDYVRRFKELFFEPRFCRVVFPTFRPGVQIKIETSYQKRISVMLVILRPNVTETSAGKNRRHWKI